MDVCLDDSKQERYLQDKRRVSYVEVSFSSIPTVAAIIDGGKMNVATTRNGFVFHSQHRAPRRALRFYRRLEVRHLDESMNTAHEGTNYGMKLVVFSSEEDTSYWNKSIARATNKQEEIARHGPLSSLAQSYDDFFMELVCSLT